MSNEIQGSRFASSNTGTFLQFSLALQDLPLRPSGSASPAKAVTEPNGKSASENALCFHFHLMEMILLFILVLKCLKT